MKRLGIFLSLGILLTLCGLAQASLSCNSCAYVTAGNLVYAWDPTANTMTQVANFPLVIDSLVFDKSGNIIASADQSGRALYKFDTTAQTYSTLISNLGTYLGDLAMDPSGGSVLVSDRGSSSQKGAIYRIDLTTNQSSIFYNGGMYPGGIIFDNSGNFFAVLGPATNKGSVIAQIDQNGNVIKQVSIPNGGDGLTFNATTLQLYVGSTGGFYTVPTDLSVANFTPVSNIGSVDGVGTSGNFVYMVHYSGNAYQYNLNNNQITATSRQVNNIDDIAPLSGFGSINPPAEHHFFSQSYDDQRGRQFNAEMDDHQCKQRQH